MGVDVEPVAFPAAGGGHVEGFAGRGRRDHGMGGVDRAALGPVSGGGVAELDVGGDVVGGQDDGAVPAVAPDGHRAVGVGGGDGPAVPVLHPPPAGGQVAVVVSGDDQITDPGGLPTGHKCGRRQRPGRRPSGRSGRGG